MCSSFGGCTVQFSEQISAELMLLLSEGVVVENLKLTGRVSFLPPPEPAEQVDININNVWIVWHV